MSEDFLGSMSISASGMSAQRKRMEAIAKNIANVETTRDENGDLYRRRFVELTSSEESRAPLRRPVTHKITLERTSARHLSGGASKLGDGEELSIVKAEEVVDLTSDHSLVFEPAHPDADENGYVKVPDINTVTEMVDMVAATRAYEANLAAMKAYQSMFNKSLEI